MINLCNNLLLKDRVQAIPAVIRKIIKPIPVIVRVIEVDVAPMIIIMSTDSKTVLFSNCFLIFESSFITQRSLKTQINICIDRLLYSYLYSVI